MKKAFFVFSNLAVSLDGKLAADSHPSAKLGSPEDRRRMFKIRALADAVICGAETLRTDPLPIFGRLKSGKRVYPTNVIISQSLEKFNFREPFFLNSHIRRIFFLSPDRRRALQNSGRLEIIKKFGAVYFFKTARVDPQWVLRVLQKLKLKNILVEGGGDIFGRFAKQNLIHKMFLTITPRLLGEKATSLTGKTAFLFRARSGLKFSQIEEKGGDLFCELSLKRERK